MRAGPKLGAFAGCLAVCLAQSAWPSPTLESAYRAAQSLLIRRAAAPSGPAASNRDVLWGIVQCLAAQPAHPPISPRAPAHACRAAAIGESAGRFVAIEDLKMLRCSANRGAIETDPSSYAFLHALALPVVRSEGLEDPNRPDGLWDFAWSLATQYVSDPSSIVLVANPRSERSQDQLHVHIARLAPGGLDRMRRTRPAYVRSLAGSPDPVWSAAQARAGGALGGGRVGVAVAYDAARGLFAVVAIVGSAEDAFIAPCP